MIATPSASSTTPTSNGSPFAEGPINIVTSGSSVWKPRQWCRSAWSMSSSETPCLRALASMSSQSGYASDCASSTFVDDSPLKCRDRPAQCAGIRAPIGRRMVSEVCGCYGQPKRVGRRSGSEAVSDSMSWTSPVSIGSERRTATTTRWASTTSLVPDRASRFPTSGPSSKTTTTTDCRNRARRACRAPSRQTWAMTGCVVVSGVS